MNDCDLGERDRYWYVGEFRLSPELHATAVSYVELIPTIVVTFIIFAIGASSRGANGWHGMPLAVKAPLYLNPVFFLTVAFAPKEQLYPEWVTCLAVFLLLGGLSTLLTLRNLSRSGDVV